ncbi:MAG: phosphatidate cytidylyltransferase [Coxiellaceae bacterium]|jgi:phosphatidate cytidylyltransferase|nr:phosphatidate cytidylyltransferase [Coxiellaceae bacterium]
MLLQRIITAIILGTLTLIGIMYLSLKGFSLLAALIMLIAAWEFSGLFKNWGYTKRSGFLIILVLIGYLTQFVSILPILAVSVLWWVMAAPYFLWSYTIKGNDYFAYFIWQVIVGIIMFVPAWVSLIVIRKTFGIEFLFYLLAIIWATDIGAYFVGRYLGKHLLAPKISPKKTWEGVGGGFYLALLIAAFWVLLLNVGLKFSLSSKITFLALTLVTCLWSVIGDLFESMLKRIAQVKDSSTLLPGHGGMYDRIDSLIAALPIFTLGLLLT